MSQLTDGPPEREKWPDDDERTPEERERGLPHIRRPKPRPAPHRLPTLGEVEALDRIGEVIASQSPNAFLSIAEIVRSTGRLPDPPEADPSPEGTPSPDHRVRRDVTRAPGEITAGPTVHAGGLEIALHLSSDVVAEIEAIRDSDALHMLPVEALAASNRYLAELIVGSSPVEETDDGIGPAIDDVNGASEMDDDPRADYEPPERELPGDEP